MNDASHNEPFWNRKLDSAASVMLLAALITGSALRIAIVLSSKFPWNDGGMFYEMIQDLIANHFSLPGYTSFNAVNIPYVYPPLPFYLGALLSFLGVDLFQILRWMPLVFSILSLPAFYLLSRSILIDRLATILATAAFAVMLTSFDRLLMGGGLTRAPGLFFALLALFALQRLYQDGKTPYIVFAALCLALTALSHPMYAWFTAYSAPVLFLFAANKRRNLHLTIWVIVGTLLFTSPWWISILFRHGLSPLRAAMQSRQALSLSVAIGQMLVFDLTREKFLDILGVMALLGLLWEWIDRKYLLPVWLAIIFLLERTSPLSLTVVPLAMLAGAGSLQIARLILQKVTPIHQAIRILLILFQIVLLYAALSSWLGFSSPVLSQPIQDAMQWAKESTPTDSRFIVISGANWWDDPASEWFPALSERVSLVTVQGYEWLPGSAFAWHSQAYDTLQACAHSGEIDCLEQWRQNTEKDFSHVFILKTPGSTTTSPPCNSLLEALNQSSHYRLMYDNDGGAIYLRITK